MRTKFFRGVFEGVGVVPTLVFAQSFTDVLKRVCYGQGVNRSVQRLRETLPIFFRCGLSFFSGRCIRSFFGIFERMGMVPTLVFAQSFKGLVLLLVSDEFPGNRGISA